MWHNIHIYIYMIIKDYIYIITIYMTIVCNSKI